MKKAILSLALVLMTPACVIVPSEVRDGIKVNANSLEGDLNKWETMSPLEQEYAMWQSVRFVHRLNQSINDAEMPTAFATIPARYAALYADPTNVAPVTSGGE